jgi:hypothetical protein
MKSFTIASDSSGSSRPPSRAESHSGPYKIIELPPRAPSRPSYLPPPPPLPAPHIFIPGVQINTTTSAEGQTITKIATDQNFEFENGVEVTTTIIRDEINKTVKTETKTCLIPLGRRLRDLKRKRGIEDDEEGWGSEMSGDDRGVGWDRSEHGEKDGSVSERSVYGEDNLPDD